MKIIAYLLLNLIGFTILAYADEPDFSPRSYLTLTYDPGLTMRSGAENITTVHSELTRVEDRLIGINWFPEQDVIGKAGGLGFRLTKYFLIDLPLDYYAVVFSHEYLGHGARYRELDVDNIHYAFDMPPPYGDGGGEASANGSHAVNIHEVLAIWMGGVEVHPMINRQLCLRWMAKREIQYREASLYFWSWQIMFRYIQDTNEDLTIPENDNDLSAYTNIINEHYGYTDYNNLPMDVKDLKSATMIDIANPFLLFSMYTIMKTYLWDGHGFTTFPTLNFKGVNYLPSFRTALTPFGLEYHMENYFRFKNKASLIDVRIGDDAFHNSWGGFGVQVVNMIEGKRYSLDANLHIWSQPEIEIGVDPIAYEGGGVGGALTLRGYYDLSPQSPVAGLVELGYKTAGFIEGYEMDASPIVMVGLGFRN